MKETGQMPGYENSHVKLLKELLKAVEEEMREDGDDYLTVFQKIESKLKSVIDILEHIQDSDKLFCNREYESLMEKIQCKKNNVRRTCRCFSCFKGNYGKELEDLSGLLERLSTLIIQIPLIIQEPHAIIANVNAKVEDIEVEILPYFSSDMYTEILPDNIFGFDCLVEKIKNELLCSDQPSIIILSAPGGYGKTTLAKMICRHKQVREKFQNNIFFVTVTKMANLKVVIKQILQQKGNKVPKFESDEQAMNYLEEKLRLGYPILLVLDDVWPEAEILVEKLKLKLVNPKILVTSRREFPTLRSTHHHHVLPRLSEEDASTLFHLLAFPHKQRSHALKFGSRDAKMPHTALFKDRDEYQENQMELVIRACNGLPLALTVVGRSFCKLLQLMIDSKSSASHFLMTNINQDPPSCIKLCLDALEDKTCKNGFFDLVSFPQGQVIPVTALIDMWAELYDIDEDGITISKLKQLASLHLLTLLRRKDASDADGCYGVHFVIQHDLLRELVIDLNKSVPVEKRERMIVEIKGNKSHEEWNGQPTSARILSVSTEDESSLSGCSSMQVPKVKVVILNLQAKTYELPEFLKTATKLRALIITSYDFLPAEILNFEILQCLSNLNRIRLEQVVVSSINLETGQLLCLKKISLVRCDIGKAFNNISDSMPNLAEITIDYCNNLATFLAAISGVFRLERLSITYCKDLSEIPQEFANLVNLEVLRLRNCPRLQQLPDKITSLEKLKILDISYCSGVRKLPEHIGDLINLEKLYMASSSVAQLPDTIKKLMQLNYVECNNQVAHLFKSLKLPNLLIKTNY